MAGTDQDVERLIKLRGEKDSLFSGRRNAAQQGWEILLKEMDLSAVISPIKAAKKWENLKKTYKSCSQVAPHVLSILCVIFILHNCSVIWHNCTLHWLQDVPIDHAQVVQDCTTVRLIADELEGSEEASSMEEGTDEHTLSDYDSFSNEDESVTEIVDEELNLFQDRKSIVSTKSC
ncbi:hypothetical protein SKAU_G00094450 [Synaphobranchus kaupii]|uniref:Myb/SANT-like DNA-binding domain-containing protein n=1 Tax=Synaphobranchus kaupii TaxID=118154 RepID=A0A9Q1FXI4_SYNKA|nr:hypothetical protein SKAU_G00094450 [Synaphobranchus kaupii]